MYTFGAGRNGLELVKDIKNSNPQKPVFLFTAYEDESKQTLAENLKVDKYMSKPIDFDILKKEILIFLQR